jgi:hypothetical protein
MKEKMTVSVSEGQTLQLHSKDGPVGKAITVPQGVSSLMVVVRGGGAGGKEGAKAGRGEKRQAKRAARKAKRAGAKAEA